MAAVVVVVDVVVDAVDVVEAMVVTEGATAVVVGNPTLLYQSSLFIRSLISDPALDLLPPATGYNAC